MNSNFSSNFKLHLHDFIQQKREVGFPYDTSQNWLKIFDRFCVENYPLEIQLTREISMHWAEQRMDEHVNTLFRRISPLRQFAKYLNSIGIKAYVIPSGIPAKGIRYVPHIYTKQELQTFFHTVDQCTYNINYPIRHLVVPVIFRVLYCCGLRSSEVTGLKIENVNLITGKLTILQSKGQKDRSVMLSEDILNLCRIYDNKVRCIFPQRTYFFPNHHGCRFGKHFLGNTFHYYWNKTGIVGISGNLPRVHDFRHTFAVNRLNQWVKEKKDLNAYLPYLSIYLGHAHLTETDYYLRLVPEFFPVMTSEAENRFSYLIREVQDEV